ncbi:GerAB/ArcD/ProY family transporter [Paenibacillus humicola]|uniref:GerAB/ArcD/ProY family transporter n=1 Tax=Paenibacillus humicola TaxID=3110540 RepID=UPI00237B88CE|nr:GerAB/ArcD/ProY family transporter [Paenibacillus humicola]
MDKSLQVMVMYLLVHIGLIYFTYPMDIIASLDVGHWSAILLGYASHVALIGIYLKGLSYFGDRSVIEIFLGAGKMLAVILLLPVAIYFLVVMTITVRAYSEIVTLIFLANTPLWAIMALLLAVTAFISALGVEALFRTALLVAVLFLPVLLLVFCLSFQNADWRYIFPLMDKKTAALSFVISRPFLLSQFAFTGGFLFMGFIPPYVHYNRRSLMWTSTLLLPLFLISVYVPLLTFGESTASRFQFPFIAAVDTVDVSWLMFDRVTMFFLISLIGFVLIFLSLLLWKTTLLFRRGFSFVRPVPAVLLLTLVMFIVCLQIPDWSSIERWLWWNSFLRLYVVTVIPVATLVLGMRHVRREAACP